LSSIKQHRGKSMKHTIYRRVRLLAASFCLIVALTAENVPADAATTDNIAGSSAAFVRAMPAAAAPPFAGISVIAKGAVTTPAVNVAHVDAGDVNALDTPNLVQTFELKNAGSGPLTIDRLQTSCHCTMAQIAAEGQAQPVRGSGLPMTLAAGEVAMVRVSVDLGILPPDELNKIVAVYLQGASQPAALLEITGVLTPSVTLTPALIDFGQAAGGRAHTLLVTASADPRLAVAGNLPPLVCSSPAIKVSEQPQATPAQTGHWMARTYEVTLPKTMPLGPINATLTFGELVSGSPAGSNTADQAAVNSLAMFRTATVLLIGQVTGDVAAQPIRMSFGIVPLGQTTTRQILLSETHAGVLQTAQVTSASPWLTANLVSEGAQVNPVAMAVSAGQAPSSGSYRVLEVTLSPDAPPGNLETQVTLKFAGGEQLIIPVNALVRA
jgi:hypothetical protein